MSCSLSCWVLKFARVDELTYEEGRFARRRCSVRNDLGAFGAVPDSALLRHATGPSSTKVCLASESRVAPRWRGVEGGAMSCYSAATFIRRSGCFKFDTERQSLAHLHRSNIRSFDKPRPPIGCLRRPGSPGRIACAYRGRAAQVRELGERWSRGPVSSGCVMGALGSAVGASAKSGFE